MVDLKLIKTYETNPRNVAGVRDFNRLSSHENNPNAVEEALVEFESEAATAIKHIEKSLIFDEKIRDSIFNLIALFSIRSPEMREHWRKFEARIYDRILDLTLATEERWESQRRQMREDDYPVTEGVSYEDVKTFHKSKQYKWELSNEHHIHMEMSGIDAILPYLYGRNWLLIQATDDSGPLITSDNPVGLTWIEPDKIPKIQRYSPGFGLTGTQVYFPISQNLALLGEFDAKDGFIIGTEEVVAHLNSRMINNAYNQVYAPKIGFKFLGVGQRLLDGRDLMRDLRDRK